MEEKNSKSSFLKTVEKTLDVLELLSERHSIGITELAQLKNIGLSTAHRILSTLENKGFAAKLPDSNKYTLGHRVYSISKSLSQKIGSVKFSNPYIDVIGDNTNENAAYCVLLPQKDKTII